MLGYRSDLLFRTKRRSRLRRDTNQVRLNNNPRSSFPTSTTTLSLSRCSCYQSYFIDFFHCRASFEIFSRRRRCSERCLKAQLIKFPPLSAASFKVTSIGCCSPEGSRRTIRKQDCFYQNVNKFRYDDMT